MVEAKRRPSDHWRSLSGVETGNSTVARNFVSLPLRQSPDPRLVELVGQSLEVDHRRPNVPMPEVPLHIDESFVPIGEQMNRGAVPQGVRMLFF